MPSRTRYREIAPGAYKGGRAEPQWSGLTVQTPSDRPSLRENCVDFVGNRSSTNPLTLHKDDWTVGWFSGHNSSAWMCYDFLQYFDAGGKFPSVPNITDAVAATIALSRLNPSKPKVNAWNFVYELKDIPQMMRQAGKYMVKYGKNPKANWPKDLKGFRDIKADLGDAYLSWTFGWDALFRDLGSLLDLLYGLDATMRNLDRLSHGSLRRRTTVLDVSVPFTVNNAFYCGPLYQAVTRLNLQLRMNRKKWVRVLYKPSQATLAMLDTDRASLARRLIYGHDLHYDTVWNALPWTWLVDWCTTAGDYLAAKRNTLQVEVADVAIMTNTTCVMEGFSFTNPYPDSVFAPNAHYKWDQKIRVKGANGPVVNSNIQILDVRQLAILGSLFQRYT